MVKKPATINYSLLLPVFSLLAFGLISLYSASTVDSYKISGTTTYYILHQLIYGVLLGFFAMFICYKLDYHLWEKYLQVLVFATIILLVMVKIPGLGFSAGGASRWLHLGFLLFQPAELAKLAIVVYIAAWVNKRKNSLNDFYLGLLPSLIIIGLFAGLILWQPDLGTMLVLVLISVSMLFVAGINWKYFFWTVILGLLSLYAFIRFAPYRAKRLTTFLNPDIDPQGISYHINQALLAIGAGGLWGYGYGLSRQKHNYLPEVMGDSIFAVTAEELGFFRIIFVIFFFMWFIVQGYKVSKNAPDTLGKMLAFGITAWIGLQALINIGAMVRLLPLTGIPLPFFSYGGTALILNLSAVGILLNISKQSR